MALGAGGNLHAGVAEEGRDLHLSPQDSLGNGDGQVQKEVASVPPESLMLLQVKDDVEIPRRSPVLS